MKNTFKYKLVVLVLMTSFLNKAGGQAYTFDRVYTANQVSNTVSVIDPSTNQLLGEIVLGKPQPNALTALYREQSLVHGLRYNEKLQLLAVVSIGSNSVTFISTRNNKVVRTLYIGRSPHEPTFTPDGRECWVTVRGESHISVIDMQKMEETRKIQVADGPGMITFTPDGNYAFICSSFSPVVDVVSTKTYKIIKTIPVMSPFSPNIFTSKDGRWIGMTHKDIGKVTIIDPAKMEVVKVLGTGPLTNHVTFSETNGKLLLSVTVGGENCIKVYDVNESFRELAIVPVHTLPHGLWASPDGKRMYVGIEYGDEVQPVDMITFKPLPAIQIGQSPQALVYAANAVAGDGDHEGLKGLQSPNPTQIMVLVPTIESSSAKGQLAIRSIGQIDFIEQQFVNLAPDTKYSLRLADNEIPGLHDFILNAFVTDGLGKYAGQSTGLTRNTVTQQAPFAFLLLVNEKTGEVTLRKKVDRLY